jgi:hypothetical protein
LSVTEETCRIVIDVRVDGEKISGSARSDVGEPKPFLGWLGLIAALDGLLDCRSLAEEPAVGVFGRRPILSTDNNGGGTCVRAPSSS